MSQAFLKSLYHYPLKSFSSAPLSEVIVSPHQRFAHDRQFAIAREMGDITTPSTTWYPKKTFFTLAKNPKLAQLTVTYDFDKPEITFHRHGRKVLSFDPFSIIGATMVEQFLAAFLADGTEILRPRFIIADDKIQFSDIPRQDISLINLNSIRDAERLSQAPIDPLRFRGNLYIDGLPAWSELDMIGKIIQIGSVQLRITEATGRCRATEVNLETAQRDINIPQLLRKGYNHTYMGVYAEILSGGTLQPDMVCNLP